tara:strand:+ start:542 stop:1012 length:471 start_codon:yes stop_codon:yes gene_type:complete
MIVQINDFTLFFNDDLEYDIDEDLLRFKSYKVNYSQFYSFLEYSINNKFELPDDEDDSLSIFCQNLSFMELQTNIRLKRIVGANLANILICNNWIRDSKYVRYKLVNNTVNDKYYYYISIIANTLYKVNKETKQRKKTKSNQDKIIMLDFIYDYYN